VVANEADIGPLSTGERIAVAFVLNRSDMLEKYWGSMLESVDRLGVEWTRAALQVQLHGW